MIYISFSGYGNIFPTTDTGRGIFIIYALVGIPLQLVFLSGIGDKLHRTTTSIQNRVSSCITHNDKLQKLVRVGVALSLGVTLMILLPAALFSHIEHWDYVESIYFSVVSMSTVGFGDYIAG